MPNIGLSDSNYEKLNKIKNKLEESMPAARPTYDSVIGWLISLYEISLYESHTGREGDK